MYILRAMSRVSMNCQVPYNDKGDISINLNMGQEISINEEAYKDKTVQFYLRKGLVEISTEAVKKKSEKTFRPESKELPVPKKKSKGFGEPSNEKKNEVESSDEDETLKEE